MNRKALQFALISYLLLRILTSAILAYSCSTYPLNRWPEERYDPQIVDSLKSQGFAANCLLLPWYRWDTYHYLIIAQDGYVGNTVQTVWPPLYPALTWVVMQVGASPLLAALLVSNLATIVMFYLLYVLVAEQWDDGVARRAVMLMTLFPVSFFLIAGYSESLFLCFVLACFWALKRKRWLLAGVMAAFASLLRQQGVFLVVPLAWEVGMTLWQDRERLSAQLVPGLAAAVLPVGAFAGFAGYVRFGLGYPWPWVTLASVWHHHLGFPWEGVIGNITALFGRELFIPAYPTSLAYDLILGGFAFFWLIVGIRSLPVSYLLFGWIMLLSATTKIYDESLFVSVSRYSLTIFPVFIAFAVKNPAKKWQIAWFIFAAFSLFWLLLSFYFWMTFY